MPELPEVETIRRGLNKKITGLTIKSVQVKKARIVKGSVKKFIAVLTGNAVLKFNRRGKLLIAALKSGQFLLMHLKMTGQLIYQRGKNIVAGGHSFRGMDWRLPNKHTHIIFSFGGGS
ncbi:MAG: DNA-formamidopyrimidine glycosylase family protein, partial [Patescibacteria group bacterium]